MKTIDVLDQHVAEMQRRAKGATDFVRDVIEALGISEETDAVDFKDLSTKAVELIRALQGDRRG